MTTASCFKSFYLCWFGPRCDRPLFRQIRRRRPSRIVEIGLGDGWRALQVIAMAQRDRESPVHYCGIDLFEARGESTVLSLKQAHHRLSQTGAKIRLVPGDVLSALARNANFLTGTDLLIVDASVSRPELDQAEIYLPRMMHPETLVAVYTTTKDRARICWLDPAATWSERRAA